MSLRRLKCGKKVQNSFERKKNAGPGNLQVLVNCPHYDDFKAQEEAYNKVQLLPIEDTCTRSLAASLLKKPATDLSSHTGKDPIRVLLSHFSKWIPLCRSVAWFIQLQRVFQQKQAGEPMTKGSLNCEEMKVATIEIVKVVQREAFSKELDFMKEENIKPEEVLRSRRKFLLPSSLRKLSPILVDGLLSWWATRVCSYFV
jgi:hypothetical protein